jgi:hypothetical protein
MKNTKLPKPKSLKKQCLDLWTEIIKLKAGYKSELSGELGKEAGGNIVLAAHHIYGKSNYRLMFDLQNGICLNNQTEHIWGVHCKNDPAKANNYYQRIINYIGRERKEYLDSIKVFKGKTDLQLVKIHLEQELKKFKENQK